MTPDDPRYIVSQAWRNCAKHLAGGGRLPLCVHVLMPLSLTDAYDLKIEDMKPAFTYVEFTERETRFGKHRASRILGAYGGQSFVCDGPTLAEFARSNGVVIDETEVRI